MRLEPGRIICCRRNHSRTLALRPVHDTPRRRIECIAPVHGAAVVPDQHVTQPPLMAPGEFRLRGVRPYFVEQRFGFLQRQAVDLRIRPPSEIERVVAAVFVPANDGVAGAGRGADILLASVAGA